MAIRLRPQTSYALKASWKGREVWSLPNRQPWTATEPFYGRVYRPDGVTRR